MDRETSLSVIREAQREPGLKINWFGIIITLAFLVLAYIILEATGVFKLFGF